LGCAIVGLVAPGYLGDLLLLDDLEACTVATVIRRGRVVTGESFATRVLPAPPAHNLLKICVLEWHGRNGHVGRGFVRGLGLRGGTLASSVGRDSHNLCAVGADDADLAVAANRPIALGGGFVAVRSGSWWRSWRCPSPGW
jgi:adenine deaminase